MIILLELVGRRYAMAFSMIGVMALALTCTMFATRQAMLGFACGLFWAIFGGYSYTLSVVPWGDVYYYAFIGSMLGMVPFTILAAYGLREKRDTIADEELDGAKSEEEKAAEGEEEGDGVSEEGVVSRRSAALRERARKRQEDLRKGRRGW